MRLVTTIAIAAVALSVVLAKPHHDSKKKSSDMLDVLDRLLTTLDKQTTVKDELIPAAGNKDSPLMKDGDTKNGCGGTYTASSGEIKSPNYPNNYPNDKNCEYRITLPAGKVVKLDFIVFKLEASSPCSYDYLEVYDGSTLTETLCGTTVPGDITTTGNTATLKFISDGSIVNEGFKISYTSEDSGCGGTYTASTGVINSPNYPNTYANNINCKYFISVASGMVIKLDFNYFNVEFSSSCSYDKVAIYAGTNTAVTPVVTECGSTLPGDVLISENTATIEFTSDYSVTYGGFSLTYTAETPAGSGGVGGGTGSSNACGANLAASSGTISSPNYPNNYDNSLNCVWTVDVPSNKIIKFTVTHFELELHRSCNYDKLEIEDVYGSTTRTLGKFCGSLSGNIPKSTKSKVKMTLTSDGSVNAKGFSINYLAVDPAPLATSSTSSCGLVTTSSFTDDNRIINGVAAAANTLPWQIVLKKNGNFICGGSIIHEKWILTAAHCITPGLSASSYSIIAGTTNRKLNPSTRQDKTVSRVITHTQYDSNTFENDIALLELDTNLNLSGGSARAICIPNSDAAVGTSCTISGWGNTVSDNAQDANYPNDLKKTHLYIRASRYCNELYGSRYNYDSNKQLCGARSTKDTCQGDSGGPFVRLDGRRYFLEGVTSYGFGCAQANTPGAYARVRYYASWINTNTDYAVSAFTG